MSNLDLSKVHDDYLGVLERLLGMLRDLAAGLPEPVVVGRVYMTDGWPAINATVVGAMYLFTPMETDYEVSRGYKYTVNDPDTKKQKPAVHLIKRRVTHKQIVDATFLSLFPEKFP